MNTIGWLESIWQDLRYGARLLRRSPGFAAVALLSLTLGIGANAAFFQLLDIVRLRSLPIERPDELVEVRFPPNTARTGSFTGTRPVLSHPIWEYLRDKQTSLADLFAYGTTSFDLSTGGQSRPVQGLWVSGGYFAALEARPAAGRLIARADDVRGCIAPSVVISHGFWQREFGGAPDVPGRTLRLDGQPVTIAGVAPRGFSGVEVARAFDVAVPICARPLIRADQPALDAGDVWWLAAFGRRKPGVTIEQVTAELTSLSPGLFQATLPAKYAAADQKNYLAFRLQASEAGTGVSGLRARFGTSLALLLGIAGLVLLIACVNLANLMLARGSARGREIAVRLAIGASRTRVVRQLLAESLLLAGLGAAGGIWVAQAISRMLVTLLTSDGSPWALNLGLEWRVLGFTTLLAVLTCVLFGLAPALRVTRTSPQAVIRSDGRGLTSSRERLLLRRALVVGQIAISLVLVVGALLFVGTLRNLAGADLGFTSDRVLVASLDLRPAGVPPDRQANFQHDIVSRLGALPGVIEASSSAIVPFSGSRWNETLILDGVKQDSHPDATRVSPAYFRALGVPFVSGRTFDERDSLNAPKVAIVNEAFVAKYLPNGNPIGRAFRIEAYAGSPDWSYEVIGVVRNTKYLNLRDPYAPIIYFPDTQEVDPAPFVSVLLRSRDGADSLRPQVTRALADVHSSILIDFNTLETMVQNSLLRERLMAALSGGFALLAAVLAAVGLYGLMSYTMARRRHEIGIRMALGATRGGILAMVLRETTVLVVLGVIVGVGLALLGGRAAATLLYGLKPSDTMTLVAGAVAFLLIGAVAAALPAQRAARVNPTVALRDDA